MADDITLPSDLKIYDSLVQTAYLERLMDNLNVFNAASRMALQMISRVIPGDYEKNAYYQVGGSVAQRDITSDAAVDAVPIGAGEAVSVKLAWKYGPYMTTYEAFLRRARSPEEFSRIVGIDMADAVVKYMIQAALGGINGALGCNTGMIVTGKTVSTDGKAALTAGLKLLGDKFSNLACWVMHSTVFFDFIDKAVSDKVYEEAGMVVYGGQPGTFGKPVVVTDLCSSTKIYGLQAGAAKCIESQTPVTRSYPVDTKENIALGYRGEGAFNVEVMGYSWDTAAGGANPSVSDLGTAANWDKHATDDKSTAGFYIDLSEAS